jgi:phospholipid/cholesterol/gamma-HCH transport system ATP-binding protein
VIRLEAVTKSFESRVLRGLDMTVPEGSLFGLVGPAACGKSTVLKILAGLVRADGGSVHVGGRNVPGMTEDQLMEYRRDIGMVFQNNALFDSMTVADNVAFPLRRLLVLGEEEIKRRVEARLAIFGLAGFGERLPRDLSGGQKKRVGIARATVADPKIVYSDEPAAGLDPVTSQRIFDLIREEQRRRGSTVIVVSSDVERLLNVTDRVGVMHEGRLVFDGTTAEARASTVPVVRQFLTGDSDGPL